MSSENASPCRTGVGTSASPLGGAGLGEEIARIILVSICPCRAGIRKWPWVVPSSSSHMVKVVRCSALASRHGAPPRPWPSAASRCSAVTANSPVVGNRSTVRDDRAGLGRVDPALAHRRRQAVVLLQPLRQLQVGPCVAADLAGLDRQPVTSRRGTGLDGGLALLRVREHPQLQALQLRATRGQVHEHLALVLRLRDSSDTCARESSRPESRWTKSATG